MDYSLFEHNRGYSLTTIEVFSLLTTTAVPFAMRHRELAETQKDNWLGHQVLFITECLPIIGVIVAAIDYLVASYFRPDPSKLPADLPQRLPPTVDIGSKFELKNDPLRSISSRTTTITAEPIPPLPSQFSTTDALLGEAQGYFNSGNIPAPLTFDEIDVGNLNDVELIESLLQKYDGICIGEIHTHSSPKYFLTVHMPLFKSLGVDTLYLEGYTGLQNDLDAYFAGDTDDLPAAIRKTIMGFSGSSGQGYTEMDVLMAAKRAGIRLVNIDSTEAYKAAKGGLLRAAAMNYQAMLIMLQDREQHPGGKSIIYAGSAHTNRIAGLPGLGQMFRFPAITLHDVCEPGCYRILKGIERNRSLDPRMESFDFLIEINEPLKP